MRVLPTDERYGLRMTAIVHVRFIHKTAPKMQERKQRDPRIVHVNLVRERQHGLQHLAVERATGAEVMVRHEVSPKGKRQRESRVIITLFGDPEI